MYSNSHWPNAIIVGANINDDIPASKQSHNEYLNLKKIVDANNGINLMEIDIPNGRFGINIFIAENIQKMARRIDVITISLVSIQFFFISKSGSKSSLFFNNKKLSRLSATTHIPTFNIFFLISTIVCTKFKTIIEIHTITVIIKNTIYIIDGLSPVSLLYIYIDKKIKPIIKEEIRITVNEIFKIKKCLFFIWDSK